MMVCLIQARRSLFYVLLLGLQVQSFSPRIITFHPHLGDIHRSRNILQASSSDTTTSSAVSSASTESSSTLRNGRPSRPTRRVTLRRYLAGIVKEKSELRDMESLSLSIQMACKTISNLVNRNGINSIPPIPQTEISSSNETNDDLRLNSMKRLDEVSTNVLRNALRFTGKLQMVKPAQDPMDGDENVFESGPAEHQPGVLIAQALDDKYVAYFDPLDGSGNADAAICSGTVFGIFETEDNGEEVKENGSKIKEGTEEETDVDINAVLQPGKNLVAAGYCLYSSATILVFTLGKGTHGFTLDPQINEFVLTHPNIRIPSRGNVYSTNEANSEWWADDLKSYVRALKTGENESYERYALRYVGSMVGDIHRTLMYGGIFFYPSDSKYHPNGNLQLLYKSAPMSYVIEQAGGKSTNGKRGLLDVKPERVHERSPCFIGSPEDIEEMKTYITHME